MDKDRCIVRLSFFVFGKGEEEYEKDFTSKP